MPEMCELRTCVFSIKAGAYRCSSAVSFFSACSVNYCKKCQENAANTCIRCESGYSLQTNGSCGKDQFGLLWTLYTIPQSHWTCNSFATRQCNKSFIHSPHIDGLVQHCSSFIANAMEILHLCPKPSQWFFSMSLASARVTRTTIVSILSAYLGPSLVLVLHRMFIALNINTILFNVFMCIRHVWI